MHNQLTQTAIATPRPTHVSGGILRRALAKLLAWDAAHRQHVAFGRLDEDARRDMGLDGVENPGLPFDMHRR
ncbi:MAG: hypothetical protein AAGB10_07685 [Pseudomonadota bacterium]